MGSSKTPSPTVVQTPPGQLSPDIQALQNQLTGASIGYSSAYAPYANKIAAQLYPGQGWGAIAPSGSFGAGTTPGPPQQQPPPTMQSFMPNWMQMGLQGGPAQQLYGPAGGNGGMPPPQAPTPQQGGTGQAPIHQPYPPGQKA